MMNDIKEAYYEDMQEKNRLAQSGRLAGFKVHPSLDQKKAEKAEVSAMNINEPMYYSDFKKLPKTMQKLYLENLFETYRCTTSAVAKMMRCSAGNIRLIASELGIKKKRGNAKTDEAFTEWYVARRQGEIPLGEVREEANEEANEEAREECAPVKHAEKREILFTRKIAFNMTPSAIGELVKAICIDRGSVSIVYEVEA